MREPDVNPASKSRSGGREPMKQQGRTGQERGSHR